MKARLADHSKQDFRILLVRCLAPLLDYWMRSVPPSLSTPYLEAFDGCLEAAHRVTLGASGREIYEEELLSVRARLPDRLKGFDEVTNNNCRRIVPMLRRAGSDGVYLDQPRPDTSDPRFWFHDYDGRPYHAENYRILSSYFMKIFMSGPPGHGPGTFVTYEKDHRARLTKTFVPKFPQLPAEIVPTIVAFAFHTGWY